MHWYIQNITFPLQEGEEAHGHIEAGVGGEQVEEHDTAGEDEVQEDAEGR